MRILKIIPQMAGKEGKKCMKIDETKRIAKW